MIWEYTLLRSLEKEGVLWSTARSRTIRSARLPGSMDPMIFPRCSARAPRRVAMDRACRAGTAVGSLLHVLARMAARRISSNMSRSLLEAAPSVPIPTFRPSSSIRVTGAKPEASLRLLVGLCAMPALECRSVRISPSSMWTQWAASTLASNRFCFFTHGTTGMPCSRRWFSTSRAVSERWVCSGTSNSAASEAQFCRISAVQV
jgi:hypothetical protein